MRLTQRKLLSCLLLATYASISVPGQGLHWLSPDDGHHHGFDVIGCATHAHSHDHACVCHEHDSCALVNADHEKLPSSKSISANDCVADSHVCEICEFLLLAISQAPQLAPPLVSQPLVATVPPPLERVYSSIARTTHAPRGPPQLLA